MKYVYFVFLFLGISFYGMAQLPTANNNIGSFKNLSSDISQEAIITQLGGFAGTGISGSQVSLIQSGEHNTSRITVNGNGNLVGSSQIGTDNNLSLDLTGRNNNYQLSQNGNSNNLDLEQVKSNNINFQVSQVLNGNELIIKGGSTGDLPALKIEQTGGMKLTIASNAFFVP